MCFLVVELVLDQPQEVIFSGISEFLKGFEIVIVILVVFQGFLKGLG